jgi:acetyl esterase/lipase
MEEQLREPPPTPQPIDGGGRWYANALVSEILGYRPLHLDLRVPPGAGPFPVVVWIHGGAWWAGTRLRLPETIAAVGFHDRLLRRGYAVADVDYRLSREAIFPAQLYDVKAAIRWLRDYAAELRLDPDRFAAWGESAGGHLAALAGLTGDPGDGVQAVVDWYGVAGLIDDPPAALPEGAPGVWLLGGQPAERPALAAKASPVNQVHPGAPPFLCMHGTADQTVPYRHSEVLTEALRAQGVRCDLHPVDGADHIFLGAPDVGTLVETSVDFLDDVLGG